MTRIVEVLPDVSGIDRAFAYEVPDEPLGQDQRRLDRSGGSPRAARPGMGRRGGRASARDRAAARGRGRLLRSSAGGRRARALGGVALRRPAAAGARGGVSSKARAPAGAGAGDGPGPGPADAGLAGRSPNDAGAADAGRPRARDRSSHPAGSRLSIRRPAAAAGGAPSSCRRGGSRRHRRPRPADLLVLAASRADAATLANRLVRSGHAVALQPEAWAEAASGGPIVVGTRGAVLAPVNGPSAIVVLDAHADSYQEERVPTWEAAVVAEERARRSRRPLPVGEPLPDSGPARFPPARHVVP